MERSGPSSVGTWKLNAAKSKFSTHPDGPREARLTVTDQGWTFSEITMSGKKSDFTDKGDATVTVKDEPTGNPYLQGIRIILKENGKEVQRTVVAVVPDGKTLLTYSSGIMEDGKPFSDVLYWDRVP
jgi:hypothetical protein